MLSNSVAGLNEQGLNLSTNSESELKHSLAGASSASSMKMNDFDFATPARSTYSNKMMQPPLLAPYERENWSISADHCYARPWNWRPETSFLRPTKTLFIAKPPPNKRKSVNPLAPLHDYDDIIDVDGDADEAQPVYDTLKAKNCMEECEKYAFSAKPEYPNEEYWEDKISKINWTATQLRIYQGFVTVLNSFQMAKLASSGSKHEPIIRRTIIDKAVERIRRLMVTVSWDFKITQWIHQLLIENLDRHYLAAYLDILQTLKNKLPSFVEKALYVPLPPKLSMLSGENIFPLLKKTWDPVPGNLVQDKPKKLPGNPVLIVVSGLPGATKRIHKWITLLSNLATVVTIPSNFQAAGNRMTMPHCVDQLFATTRSKIQEIRGDYPGRNIVLVGLNAGATLALQVASVEPVLCVVCLGFSLLTAEGRRGEPDDNLLELQHPVLFVIGQCSNTSSQEDVEEFRERMRIETGLIVVGSADDYLRVNKKKKRSEGITQSIVDRCILEEIAEFISGFILSPCPPQLRQSPTQFPVEPSTSMGKKGKNERKRYNSNASSLDSEPPSPTMRITRPGLKSNSPTNFGRPPGSKAKAKLDAKWSQMAQGTSSPSSSPPPLIYTPDTSSNDSSLMEKVVKAEAPVKKLKTLRPVDKGGKVAGKTTQITPSTQQQHTIIGSAYGFNRAGGQLSTLLQGGLKTMAPNQPKNTGIKVLENVTLNSGTKFIGNTGRTLDLSKITVISPLNAGKQQAHMSNVVLMPDGKIQSIHGPHIKGGKYITSKRQLIGNKPPRPVKKVAYIQQHQQPQAAGSLTTQDIMDLPIIFADDNQILDHPEPKLPPSSAPSNKFVLVNKQMNPTSNFIISPSSIKNSPTPKPPAKYTKIILSKRNSTDEQGAKGQFAKLSALTEQAQSSSNNVFSLTSNQPDEPIDLESELVATAVPKPNLATSDIKNITVFKQSSNMPSPIHSIISTNVDLKRNAEDLDEGDPDYVPPKNMKIE